ncbi:MAG: RNA polymerase sigma factor [Gammaproteobacteria bacterium]
MDTERYTAGPGSETAVPDVSDRFPCEADIAERFRERVRLFATRRLGNAVAAEDVAQETLRRAVDALRAGRIDTPAAFPAFVFATARHICQQHHRSAGREGRALHRLHDDSSALGPAATDPFAALVSEERARSVRKALGGLATGDCALLRMLFHEQLETADVATRLGLSPTAVRVRKHRALKRLGELLGETDF